MAHAGTGQPGNRPEDNVARVPLPNPFANPAGFAVCLLIAVPVRIVRSMWRTVRWMYGAPIQNNNHSLINYIQVRQRLLSLPFYADLCVLFIKILFPLAAAIHDSRLLYRVAFASVSCVRSLC